jgi:hypothetical protein
MSSKHSSAVSGGGTVLSEESTGVYSALFSKINLSPVSTLGDIEAFQNNEALSEISADERVTAAVSVFLLRRLGVLLQGALRSTALDANDLPRLGPIERQLAHLHLRLVGQPAGTVNPLDGLRQQIARLACRIERDSREQARRGAGASIKPPDAHAAEHPAVPGIGREIENARQPDTKPGAARRRLAWLACLGLALLVLLAAFTGS